MSALWFEPEPSTATAAPAQPAGPAPGRRPALRLVEGGAGRVGRAASPDGRQIFGGSMRRPRVPAAVRRRRTLLAVLILCLIALALPLGGTGGDSHPTGSALAGTDHPVTYRVQPGDSLWSIAEHLDPTADPRPLVSRLAAQVGSDSVQPGERIVVP